MDWPADKIERWSISKLTPNARNARTHSDAQVDQLAASIQEWGWTTPVLVSETGMLIAGHGRVRAAQKLGLTEVPVMVARGWTKAQIQAYALADNKLALNAGWDEGLVAIELAELEEIGFDIDLIGFNADEIAALGSKPNPGLTDPDEVPEPPVNPITQPGDIWLLGRHRLLCGDSTSAADVDQVLAGVRPNLMVTDPPYGVNYDPAWRNDRDLSRSKRTGKVENDGRADWAEAWELFPGSIAYVWHAALHSPTSYESLIRTGFDIRAQIIWAKERLVIGRGDYHWQHEPCWYAVRKKGNWCGDRKQTTLWNIPNTCQDTKSVHGTQKPVECMKRPIENNSSPGHAVYEPFSGSGTTIIAAEITGRSCHAIELSPQYVDVAVERWQAFTGESARLGANGEVFVNVGADRRGG
ncbi:site-specific DNA-methyltransferase [Rhodoplanes sp. Z2-YC6860]|uniref:site-specific DNA-methyltransferase n=1 Tax=Rhodoplanes sp. Z2-YC6860 TaxID=674703 RepID=UPI00078DA769|nr:site-specific DNA-methyltransferase [Rhodoplanes sp. Z2-YC6860]AMN44062.1 DNA methylase N-4/N-6 [Rhodoplanes sp. Z2-YC6860]